MEIMFYNVSQVPIITSITGGGIPEDPIKQTATIPPNGKLTFTIFGDFVEQIQCTPFTTDFSATLTLNDSSFLNKYQKFSINYQGGCGTPYFFYCFPISILPVVG